MLLRRLSFAAGTTLLAVWVALVFTLVMTYRSDASDWTIFFDAAVAFRAWPHANFWNDVTTMAASHLPGACPIWPHESYKFPPLLLILLYPLTYIQCTTATLVWRIIMLALWVGIAANGSIPLLRASQRGWALVAATLILTYPPLIDGMLLGQDHILTLALMTAAVTFEAGRKQWVAGAALAVGFWIKYIPAILGLYYLLTGRWRVAVSSVLVGLGLLLAQVALVGPTAMVESLNPAAGIDVDPVWAGWPGDKLWGYVAVMVFIGGVGLACWRFRESDDALGIGWALCTLLFFSPAIRWYYLTWLIPAFWACLVAVVRLVQGADIRGWKRWVPKALLVGLILIYGISFVPYNPTTMSATIVGLWLLNGFLYLLHGWASSRSRLQRRMADGGATDSDNRDANLVNVAHNDK